MSGETGAVTSDMNRVGGWWWWAFCSIRILGIVRDGDDGWRGWSVTFLDPEQRVVSKEILKHTKYFPASCSPLIPRGAETEPL